MVKKNKLCDIFSTIIYVGLLMLGEGGLDNNFKLNLVIYLLETYHYFKYTFIMI